MKELTTQALNYCYFIHMDVFLYARLEGSFYWCSFLRFSVYHVRHLCSKCQFL